MLERLGLQTEADVRLDKNQRWFKNLLKANMATRKTANGSKLNLCLLIPLASENTPPTIYKPPESPLMCV